MVYSDHSALLSLCSKELIKIPNNRLLGMLEKLSDFNFKVKHLPGSQKRVADFLSRHPLPTQEAPQFQKNRSSILVRTAKSQKVVREDGSLWEVARVSQECKETQTLMEEVKMETKGKDLPQGHPGRNMADSWTCSRPSTAST